jgi:FtsP/CotA-like multicopper oxidase with cupredoxin domain
MIKKNVFFGFLFFSFVALTTFFISRPAVFNQRNISSVSDDVCPRETVGGEIVPPPDLYSKDGVLEVSFSYESKRISEEDIRYCYMFTDSDGKRRQSPTLHIWPGEHIKINIANNTKKSISTAEVGEAILKLPTTSPCNSGFITPTSMNVHFHGTNTPAACGADDVVKTVINSGESYTYDLLIPKDEPPGLYFYHPHIHGTAQDAAWGGATGAIVVEGLQNYFPELAGLNERVLVLRDNPGPNEEAVKILGFDAEADADKIPGFNVSLNYHPVHFPDYKAPILRVKPEQTELWRIVNSSADAIFDVEVDYDGKEQPLTIYAIDAVPVNTHGIFQKPKPLVRDHWTLAPGNRIEFTVKTPGLNVKKAELITEKYDTGADVDPNRRLASILADNNAPDSKLKVGAFKKENLDSGEKNDKPETSKHRFSNIRRIVKNAIYKKERKLFFNQFEDKNDASKPVEFYLTVDKKKDEVFKLDRKPDITTVEDAIEEWTIENRTEEAHVFHIHQIHFLLLERNSEKVLPEESQSYDTITVPKWDGKGKYPSVKLRMDFHEAPPGVFVYHCHILEHEDKGMMGIIQVLSEPDYRKKIAQEAASAISAD